MVPIGSCGLLAPGSPSGLNYLATPGNDELRVSVTIAGGPRPTAWVGFGAGPLAAGSQSRRIDQVTARTVTGSALGIRAVGDDAYRVDVTTNDAWVLEYRAVIGAPPVDFYHRASSSSADHMMLVGVDVWARFFDAPAAISAPLAGRPLGNVVEAGIRFDVSGLPDDWIVVSASPEVALNQFELSDHPARSVFALGPYRYHDIDRRLGLKAAIHPGWNVGRRQLVGYVRQLARAQASQFGPPPGDPALMIFTPFPSSVTPRQGVRTAGMVWDRSLLLFAGADRSAPLNDRRVLEMLAIFLGHEIFHLYIPWGLPVTQPLSWLSEGWAEHVGRTSARTARLLNASGDDRSLREAYARYLELGGARAGSLQNASEAGEDLRPLLYVRGELVFRILSLEWAASGKPGSFDSAFWLRLMTEYDGDTPLEPEAVSRILSAMVSPSTVRRLVDGAAVITLPELKLGRR